MGHFRTDFVHFHTEGPNRGYPRIFFRKSLVQSLVNILIGNVTIFQSLSLSRLEVRDAQKSVGQFEPPPCIIGLRLFHGYFTALQRVFQEYFD